MRQALEMALEALEESHPEAYRHTITAIKESLAQPEQEPVAWVGPWHDCRLTLIPRHSHQTFEREQPLYTTPPQPEQKPCDMKEMCIECSPRNADGSCPDAQPEYQSTADKSKLEKVPAKGTLLAQSEHEFVRGECMKCGASIERQEPVAWLTDDERKALERFNETCEDGEGYDVPKPMMKRLAEIGVIHHTSRGIYGITKFGCFLLGYTTPPQRKPLTDEQIQKCYETTGHYQTLRPQDKFAVFALARAIEAAHGIKE